MPHCYHSHQRHRVAYPTLANAPQTHSSDGFQQASPTPDDPSPSYCGPS
ncbi:MAG: hypothetical protein AAGB19_12240 [Cyanobacteria bacterium P01_F01_bin.3]